MRSMVRRPWLAMLAAAAACHHSDPGGQCSSLAQCAAGSYCDEGTCRSDCASPGDCGPGEACTPQGQCLRLDNLYCEEGAEPSPPQYAKALSLGNPFLLQDVADCTSLAIVNSGDLPGSLGSGAQVYRACADENALQQGAGLLMVGQLGACRPARIEADRVLWHALPTGLDFVFGSIDQVDTVMEARPGPEGVDFVAGAPPPGTLDGPLPGRVWASGTGSLDGTFLKARYQSAPLQAESLRYTPDAGDIGGPAAVLGVRATGADGGVEVDVTVQYPVSVPGAEDVSGRVVRDGDHISASILDPHDGGLRYVLQLDPAYDGRYDDAVDGGVRSVCWNTFTDGGQQVVYARDVDQTFGDESSCLYPRGTP